MCMLSFFFLQPQNNVWKPDIALTNSFTTFSGLGAEYLNIKVDFNGTMNWYPYQVLDSTCSVTITYFPFDEQTCELRFSAWSYTKEDVVISLGKKGILLDRYVPNALWDLIETDDKNIRNTDEATVVFSLKLKRKPKFYILTIITPLILLSLLNTFAFMLPVTSGERSGYSITVFLSLAIFLTIVSDQLPKNSEHVSLLAVYIMSVTALSTFIVIICLIELRMQSWHETPKPINRFFRNFIAISDCFHCRSCRKTTVTPTGTMSATSGKTSDQITGSSSDMDVKKEAELVDATWLDVIDAIDFIFFLASLMYTFTCTLIIGVLAVQLS
ncbi:Acetylcholine-activated cation-selective channel [Mactra antiquata]